MKKYFLLVFLFSALTGVAQTSQDFKKLGWLVGEWDRTNVSKGNAGIEKWIANSAFELQGWGITMKESDTAFVEKTKLIVRNDTIYYVADVPGNKQPVYFKITAITESSFTCENSKHDFPKKITYTKNGNKLKATISGGNKSIDYLFDKKP